MISPNFDSISDSIDSASTLAGSRFDLFEHLAEDFGTPFYLYDADELADRAAELSGLLPAGANSQVLFSFKSNPNPLVSEQLREAGCRADLTSPGELVAAKNAGFDLSEALYGGPGKSEEELVGAISAGVRSFSVESPEDLSCLARAARSEAVRVRGLIRINPSEAPKAKLAMSGVASQFGFEEADLRVRGNQLLDGADEWVDLVGVHIYWGTQIGEVEALLACFEKAIEIAEDLSEQHGFPLEVLNLGGGFPWPYSKEGRAPDLSDLKEGLENLHENAGRASDAEWWFESGRFLCASSGTLVTRVMDRKVSKDEKEFLILDTGIHHLGGMAGLGRIPRFSIDLIVPPERAGNEEIEVDVVGQLCTPLDCIGRRLSLSSVEPGDLVAVPNVGAYGVTASVVGFLSRPTPVEILHRGGQVLGTNRLRSGHESFEG